VSSGQFDIYCLHYRAKHKHKTKTINIISDNSDRFIVYVIMYTLYKTLKMSEQFSLSIFK